MRSLLIRLCDHTRELSQIVLVSKRSLFSSFSPVNSALFDFRPYSPPSCRSPPSPHTPEISGQTAKISNLALSRLALGSGPGLAQIPQQPRAIDSSQALLPETADQRTKGLHIEETVWIWFQPRLRPSLHHVHLRAITSRKR